MMAIKKATKLSKTQPVLTRREFIRDVALTSTIAAGISATGYLSYSQEPLRPQPEKISKLKDFRITPSSLFPLLAVVHGTDTFKMVTVAINKLGGIERFIKRGDTVLLKPNVGWDRQPEQAANTNPEVVAAVVKLCIQAGAETVTVTDVSLNDPNRCFFRSGIGPAAEHAGANVRIPRQDDFLLTDLHGERLQKWPVCRFFHTADKVINLPIVKHHSLCECTLAMKNWYGILGGKRNQLHQAITTSIVDLAAALRPTLTIMDATRVLKRNGPTGGNLNDVSRENTIIAGLDEVAIDAYSLQFLQLTADQVPFLAMAHKRGLGVVDWRTLAIAETQLG